MKNQENRIVCNINGPILKIKGDGFFLNEMVLVNNKPGEVISVNQNSAIVQMYENTAGFKYGDIVTKTNKPLSVTMKPGLLGQIFDGIFRPLSEFKNKPWDIKITVKPGQFLKEGETFASCIETPSITYKANVPEGVNGKVKLCKENGSYFPEEKIISIETSTGLKELDLTSTSAIRTPLKIKSRLISKTPLITGQRIIDSFFPIVKGGTCIIPGGFGTGKTMTQHQIAKWCDADIIIYIGCGERGNEMAEVLEDFAKIIDPRTGEPLLSRMVLIANTSDMPVAARESSIYTGITIAEFYRNMGYHVALMADSTSRFAEALREISNRLEEIPAEEGYPAYLATRLASFYSRAGFCNNLNGTFGSITIIGAVSPQGGDFTEPVTTHSKRFAKNFWALDRKLAYARFFPAINWAESYSGYKNDLADYFAETISPKFFEYSQQLLNILYEEYSLKEIINIIGEDSLNQSQRDILQHAKKIKETFIYQNAYDPLDTYTSLEKQFEMMEALLQ